jgi:murein DD-endopeptidase MepM/ murein hydrolase activator NlpD
MKPEHWLWLGLGSVGALVIFGRRRDSSGASLILGSPVEGDRAPMVTPHGYFGAPRAGPPSHTHQGVDVAAPPGSYVLAVGDGVIVRTDPGLGKIVRKLRLDAPAAWSLGHRHVGAIVYADLGPPLVKPGDRVRKGDPIALVDKAGFVHFATKDLRATGEVFFDPKEAGFIYRLSSRPAVA